MPKLTKLLKITEIVSAVLLAVIIAFVGFLQISKRNQVYKLTEKVAVNCNLDTNLVLAIVKVESNFNPNAISAKGAVGLMQILPSTSDYVCKIYNINNSINLNNAEDNLLIGCYYVKYLIAKFANLNTVLACYNAGEGVVSKWLADENCSKDGKSLYKIPYRETANYVKKVQFYLKYYSWMCK